MEQLLTLDLVAADRGLAFGRDQPQGEAARRLLQAEQRMQRDDNDPPAGDPPTQYRTRSVSPRFSPARLKKAWAIRAKMPPPKHSVAGAGLRVARSWRRSVDLRLHGRLLPNVGAPPLNRICIFLIDFADLQS